MYTPKPIRTSEIELPESLQPLVETLAAHNHDIWARGRIREGWTWGPKRDDENKKHPDLVPYDELSESEKEYDRNSVKETLKAIISLGYELKNQ